MGAVELLSQVEAGVLVLTMNRPEAANAISFEMLELYENELERAAMDPAIHSVVLTGQGLAAFSVGLDLGLLFEHITANPSGEQIRRVQRELQELFTLLEHLEKPTIAAIEGTCSGGGLELALACDLRVASADAKFSLPETKLGMLPWLGGTSRLARLAGPAAAKEWIFTGRTYSSVRALELGLITELVVPGDARARAVTLAKELAANSPLAIGWAKRIVDRAPSLSLEEALELEQHAMSEILPGPQLREGVLAFLEKRAPKFR